MVGVMRFLQSRAQKALFCDRFFLLESPRRQSASKCALDHRCTLSTSHPDDDSLIHFRQ